MPTTRRAKRVADTTPIQRQKVPKKQRREAPQSAPSPPPATPSQQQEVEAPPKTEAQQQSVVAPQASPPPPTLEWQQPDWWIAGDEDKARHVRACLDIGNQEQSHAVPEGREHEAAVVQQFVTSCLRNMQGGSLYISGRPGTGKSLTVHSVLEHMATATGPLCGLPPALVSINCYAIGDVRDVFDHMASGIEAACAPRAHQNSVLRHAVSEGPVAGAAGPSGPTRLSKLVTAPVATERGRDRRKSLTGRQSRGMYVVLLDEMDQLLQHPSAALIPQLLSMAGAPGSRLVLLGVANSIDLVERMLGGAEGVPHLQHMSFKAYTPVQIQAVLQRRLASLPGPVFAPPALMLCARKVAAASGDMRRALEVCRKAVDLAAGGLVGMREVAAALARVNGGAGSASTRVAAIRDLPLQQQLLLCAARKVMAKVEAAPEPPRAALSPIALNGQARRTSIGGKRLSLGGQTPGKRLSLGGQTPGKRLSLGGQRLKGDGGEATQADVLDAYVKLCESIGVAHVTKEEFFSMCSNMVDNSYLVTPAGRCGDQPRLQRVGCAVTDAELMEAVKDNRLLRNVLLVGAQQPVVSTTK